MSYARHEMDVRNYAILFDELASTKKNIFFLILSNEVDSVLCLFITLRRLFIQFFQDVSRHEFG